MTPTARVDEMSWSDLRVVLAIARAGSLAGAATSLQCNHSTVFRRLGGIEGALGVRLFERMPTGYTMTEAGQIAMGYAERIEAEFHALHREVTGLDGELRGHVVITAPAMLAGTLLPGLVAEFRREHPGVTCELIAGHEKLDLKRRQADLAIRATKTAPADYVGRRLCDFRFGLYASPEYLARSEGRGMYEHELVVFDGTHGFFVPGAAVSRADAEARTVFCSNSVPAVIAAAQASVGVLAMSRYSCDVADGLRLVAPMPEMDMGLWLLMHPDLKRTARVKALMGFLADHLLARAHLFSGDVPGRSVESPPKGAARARRGRAE